MDFARQSEIQKSEIFKRHGLKHIEYGAIAKIRE
jgi:hypothetical protein